MDETDVIQAIADSEFGSRFPHDDLQALAAGAYWERRTAGSVLFREGDRSDSFYVVHRGHVALEMSLPARGRIRILTLGPGDIVAWSALLDEGLMTATAVATEETELIRLSGSALNALCEVDSRLGCVLLRRVAEALADRLVATRLQLLDLFADQAPDGVESP
jgi:CRP-like cAMP-binding protein